MHVVNDPKLPSNDAIHADEDQVTAGARSSNSALVILGMWALQFAYFTVDRTVRSPGFNDFDTLVARLIVTASGAMLSFGVLAALRRSASWPFLTRAALAIVLAAIGAAVQSIFNVVVFRTVMGPGEGASYDPAVIVLLLPQLAYFFLGVHLVVALVLLSIAYGEDIIRREREISLLSGKVEDLVALGAGEDTPHLWVRNSREKVRLDIESIDWVAAEGEYVRLHARERSFLERTAISQLADRLAPFGFVRIHRSTVVNTAQVQSLSRTASGAVQVRLVDGTELRVGKSFQPTVREALGARVLSSPAA